MKEQVRVYPVALHVQDINITCVPTALINILSVNTNKVQVC